MNDALPDAGGGYPDGRNVDALEWMIEQGQEAGAPFRDLNKQNYKDYDNLASPQLHDSRYPIVDRVPFTHWGRSTRVVFPGKKLKNMRYLIILFILSIVTGCSSGCSGIQKNKMIVTAKITNASTNVLDWVDIEWEGPYMAQGILSPGISKGIVGLHWPNLPGAKVTFIDKITRKPYSIQVSFVAVNEQIQAGKCREVTIRILSYEKAEVACE